MIFSDHPTELPQVYDDELDATKTSSLNTVNHEEEQEVLPEVPQLDIKTHDTESDSVDMTYGMQMAEDMSGKDAQSMVHQQSEIAIAGVVSSQAENFTTGPPIIDPEDDDVSTQIEHISGLSQALDAREVASVSESSIAVEERDNLISRKGQYDASGQRWRC